MLRTIKIYKKYAWKTLTMYSKRGRVNWKTDKYIRNVRKLPLSPISQTALAHFRDS